ncbi:dethiobiotin synthase [Moraxella nasicaprae]|uniref:ATP-dependent dethiobiotin synthetase BioD n=1 Tax=Moraxella nasicaprae TaxID=2904122 RepID=A0ABY6F6F5_9GAMM|nr:dethiobiotin synthase [Moraxella nasicaprae]UXZ05671.1 dethiobiotin synthase [Moraxella nasicaprae]
MQGVYFISGIDTDIGKSIATGIIAKRLLAQGISVITQKPIETGNQTISQDIMTHRRLMGCDLLPQDYERLTMPVLLPYPASPHLSAKLANQTIDFQQITTSTKKLADLYQVVLVEGAGGLMVPLTDTLLTIDYVAQCGYRVILVTSGRLGSINHTLLSLQALKARDICVHALAYNEYHDGDGVIANDTKNYLQAYLSQHHPQTHFWQIPSV